MLLYITKRLGQTIFVLIGITLITFILLNVVPGDPVKLMLEKRGTPEMIQKVRHDLGIDKPLPQQYLDFLSKAVRFDFGRSYLTREQVTTVLFRSFQVTAQLTAISFLFAVGIGLSCGILAAIFRGTMIDSSLMTVAMLGISAPSFWVAIILQIIFGLKLEPFLKATFDIQITSLPLSGIVQQGWFILPGIALGTRYAGSIARITRTSMLDVIKQDYIRTARAKGVKESVVMIKHALKNALIPIVTLIGTQLGYMLTGSMLIEKVFSIPGIGKLAVDNMATRDLPMLQGIVIYIATIFVLINLFVDISYAFIDPRIRYGKGAK